MKILILISIVLFFGCSDSSKKERKTSPDSVTHKSLNQDESTEKLDHLTNLAREMEEKSLSKLDFSKFPSRKVDTLNNLDWEDFKKLTPITEVYSYIQNEGKYYANLTFTDNFKTFLIGVYEGGDCGPALWLVNSKEDSILSQRTIYQKCGWENGSHSYSSIKKNDSTLLVTLDAQGKSVDSKGNYIADSISHRLKKEQVIITSNGQLIISVLRDTSWTTFDLN